MSHPQSAQPHRNIFASAMRSWAALRYRALAYTNRGLVCSGQASPEPPALPIYSSDSPGDVPRSEQPCDERPEREGDILPLYFERLIEHVDPHVHPLETAARHAQVAAGRWLLMRRLQRNLTLVEVAQRTEMTPAALQIIEAGVANAALLPPTVLERLASMLSQSAEDREQVVQVLCEALGQAQLVQIQPRRRHVNKPMVCTPATSPAAPIHPHMLVCLVIPILLIGLMLGIGWSRYIVAVETLAGARFFGAGLPVFTWDVSPLSLFNDDQPARDLYDMPAQREPLQQPPAWSIDNRTPARHARCPCNQACCSACVDPITWQECSPCLTGNRNTAGRAIRPVCTLRH